MKQFGKVLSLFGPFLGLAFIYGVFLAVVPSGANFSSLYNTKTILQQSVLYGVGAIGMTLVIISAGIDVSGGSLLALGSVVTALILRGFGPTELSAQASVGLACVAALGGVLACALAGFLNGLMISGLRIVPFIVTLGMMQIARGAAKGVAENTVVTTPGSWLRELMKVEPTMDSTFSFAPAVWLMLGLMGVMFIVMRYTVFGRRVFAIGSNEDTARLCGVNVPWTRIWVYTLCGVFTGIASVLQFGAIGIGSPTEGVAYELDVIAAVVIGGGSFSGGQGSIVGSIIGAIIIAVLRNGCPMVGWENHIQNVVVGAIIIVAVGIDQLKRARQS